MNSVLIHPHFVLGLRQFWRKRLESDAEGERVFLVCSGTEVRKLASVEKVMLLVFADV